MKILSGSLPVKKDEEHAVMIKPQIITETEMPPDYFFWSLVCCLMNPFLGLAAVYKSLKARNLKMVGDLEGAYKHGSTARTLNFISTVVCVLFVVVILCVLFINDGPSFRESLSFDYIRDTGYSRSCGTDRIQFEIFNETTAFNTTEYDYNGDDY
ncbi:hypothetical protein WMY93_022292 [Mugilogobius chulae]|uniref:Uncharacterized protein n=1 Tax=Mugilogobius chulae TaxID=88201 RepID=A0AAW0NH71_9GOBI